MDKTEELDKQSKDMCHCKNCKYFEERSGFCRLNPPTPMTVQTEKGSYVTSVYPKIGIPEVDYCHKFEEK